MSQIWTVHDDTSRHFRVQRTFYRAKPCTKNYRQLKEYWEWGKYFFPEKSIPSWFSDTKYQAEKKYKWQSRISICLSVCNSNEKKAMNLKGYKGKFWREERENFCNYNFRIKEKPRGIHLENQSPSFTWGLELAKVFEVSFFTYLVLASLKKGRIAHWTILDIL